MKPSPYFLHSPGRRPAAGPEGEAGAPSRAPPPASPPSPRAGSPGTSRTEVNVRQRAPSARDPRASLTVFSGIQDHGLRRGAGAQVVDGLDLDLVGRVDGRSHHPQAVLTDGLLLPLAQGPLRLPGHPVLQPRPVLLQGFQRLKREAGCVSDTRTC